MNATTFSLGLLIGAIVLGGMLYFAKSNPGVRVILPPILTKLSPWAPVVAGLGLIVAILWRKPKVKEDKLVLISPNTEPSKGQAVDEALEAVADRVETHVLEHATDDEVGARGAVLFGMKRDGTGIDKTRLIGSGHDDVKKP